MRLYCATNAQYYQSTIVEQTDARYAATVSQHPRLLNIDKNGKIPLPECETVTVSPPCRNNDASGRPYAYMRICVYAYTRQQ